MEIWKDIKDYKGYYQVSDLGRIKSLDRVITTKDGKVRSYKSKVLKETLDGRGYYKISLNKKGKLNVKKVHRLVLSTFTGKYYKGHEMVCDHIDNNPLNNKLDNLQWITQRSNCSKDRVKDLPTGIYYNKSDINSYRAMIFKEGKLRHIGVYPTVELALGGYNNHKNN